MKIFSRAVVVSAILCASAHAAFSQKIINSNPSDSLAEVVFRSGENGYSTFRIPAIVKASDGSLLAFCEGRRFSAKDHGDIDLVMKRSVDGGSTWGTLTVVRTDPGNTCGNPSPVVDRKTGRIILVSCWNRGDDVERDIEQKLSKDTRRVFVQSSSDNGLSWSKAKDITAKVKLDTWTWYATGPCHSIQLQEGKKAGRIVVPCNHGILKQDPDNPSAQICWTESHLIYSDNLGRSWKIGAVADDGNESTITELKGGNLYWSMRGRRIKPMEKRKAENGCARLTAYVQGAGTEIAEDVICDGKLIEPVCNGSVLNLPGADGKLSDTLLFSGPFHHSKRQKMSVRISRDGGKTWPEAYVIRKGLSAYSDILSLDGGYVAVLYEAGEKKQYECIKFIKISEKLLKN